MARQKGAVCRGPWRTVRDSPTSVKPQMDFGGGVLSEHQGYLQVVITSCSRDPPNSQPPTTGS